MSTDATPPTIEISEYDPAWPQIAARLAEAISTACADAVQRVEHIGSTSVPGLGAKPVIDLMPVLASFEDGARCVAPMEQLGYEYRGEYGIPGRHYFPGHDEESGLRVHVHMLVDGSEEYRNHLLFRDYLREHPAEAAAYEAMKRTMAEEHAGDRQAYTDAKTPWITACLERARVWRSSGATAPSRFDS